MLNCPGASVNPGGGSETNVTTSSVSRCTSMIRLGSATKGSSCPAGIGAGDDEGSWTGGLASTRSAATSSVRSIPTGHQEMQRPQPTHPLVPNGTTHDPSLWVSH